MRKYKLLRVEWVDSVIRIEGWEPLASLGTQLGHLNISVGFLIADDDRGVVLAGSLDAKNKRATGIIAIPSVAIRKRSRLTT